MENKDFEKQAYSAFLGIELTEVTDTSAEGRMRITEDLLDQLGHTTGGAYNSLGDAVAGACARASGAVYVTQGCSMEYYVSTELKDAYLYAKASVRHRGSRSCIIAVELFHKDGTVAADGQYTYCKIS